MKREQIALMVSGKIPKVPNFILFDDENKVALKDLTDLELEEIGKVWTQNLIERAKEQRNN